MPVRRSWVGLAVGLVLLLVAVVAVLSVLRLGGGPDRLGVASDPSAASCPQRVEEIVADKTPGLYPSNQDGEAFVRDSEALTQFVRENRDVVGPEVVPGRTQDGRVVLQIGTIAQPCAVAAQLAPLLGDPGNVQVAPFPLSSADADRIRGTLARYAAAASSFSERWQGATQDSITGLLRVELTGPIDEGLRDEARDAVGPEVAPFLTFAEVEPLPPVAVSPREPFLVDLPAFDLGWGPVVPVGVAPPGDALAEAQCGTDNVMGGGFGWTAGERTAQQGLIVYSDEETAALVARRLTGEDVCAATEVRLVDRTAQVPGLPDGASVAEGSPSSPPLLVLTVRRGPVVTALELGGGVDDATLARLARAMRAAMCEGRVRAC